MNFTPSNKVLNFSLMKMLDKLHIFFKIIKLWAEEVKQEKKYKRDVW